MAPTNAQFCASYMKIEHPVICNDSINHFHARVPLFREWRRVLEPGGRILGAEPFATMQRFLKTVHVLSEERRLCRFLYRATNS
jgi:hypothetical protein